MIFSICLQVAVGIILIGIAITLVVAFWKDLNG